MSTEEKNLEQVFRRIREEEERKSGFDLVTEKQRAIEVNLAEEEKCATLRRKISDRLEVIKGLIDTSNTNSNDWYRRGYLKTFSDKPSKGDRADTPKRKKRKKRPILEALSIGVAIDSAEPTRKEQEAPQAPKKHAYLSVVEGGIKILLRSDGSFHEQIHKKCIFLGEKLSTGGDLQSKSREFLEDLLHRLEAVESNEHLPVIMPR